MVNRGAMPAGCRRSAMAKPWSLEAQLGAPEGVAAQPRAPVVAPLRRELARPTVRLPQGLAGVT